ncbi:Flp family type IVb pilin [Pseudomonas sp. C1C7]|uniref:Flp family type IVb pilin n=1 Tax=Pseudomonas sp. C1C7 TaxID=2735272 RepID=UPI001586B47D|nr:Flp family type IVb pilin [Pseudomonas sp. C1C7]NUT79262.1 Flp family type IVb pilin [Pseudomonas sp. C1C7]
MSFSKLVQKVKSQVIFAHCKKLVRDTEGASGIEYAIVAAMVAVVIVGFTSDIGDSVSTIFTKIKEGLE